jgi:hypothetical protein
MLISPTRFNTVNRALTLGANIGVVLGLIILIAQLRQNAALTRLSMEASKDNLLATIELNLASADKAAAWVKSYQAPDEMTDVEIRMVESHLVALMLQWDYLFQMEARGLIPRAEVENHVRNTAPFYFGSRFGKAWFRGEAPGWQGTRMMAVAGPIVSGLPDDFMKTHYASLRAGALPPAAQEKSESSSPGSSNKK